MCLTLPKPEGLPQNILNPVMSDSLQPHGLQHIRLPYPSPIPRSCSNSCSSSWWRHPASLSSVVPFSCLHSFPALGSFLRRQFFTSGGQGIDPIDTPKPTTGHCTHCPSERWDPAPSKRIQAEAPTRRTSQNTNPTPSMGSGSTIKNNDLKNLFLFSVLNHTVYSCYIILPSH